MPSQLENTLESAMISALKLLGIRNHSLEELKRKLLKKGFDRDCIDQVLDRLTARGILDDRVFGSDLIRSQSRRKPSGTLKIRAELLKKGVSGRVADELLKNYDSLELCMKAAEKKTAALGGLSVAARKKKLGTFLHNRGFTWQEIKEVLERFFPDGPDQDTSC
jgi:regulatory protein